jgi:hypothetical protein
MILTEEKEFHGQFEIENTKGKIEKFKSAAPRPGVPLAELLRLCAAQPGYIKIQDNTL